ncbi:MAG: hypothetical protein ACFCU6_02410 [Balneolaceae bacterium]
MKQTNYLIFLILIPFILFSISCEQKTDYEQLVEQELNKGVRSDSLFLGYYLGMDRQEFFDHSWELNRRQIVTGGSQVEYRLENLSKNATMKFYPKFKNDKIYEMPVEISYDAWAPWNRDLFSDSLIVELLDFYRNEYGDNFIHTIHPENGKMAWISVNGNRRISIFKKDDAIVQVEFVDLLSNDQPS